MTEYPKHESCLKCHWQQFFKGATPAICSICHTDPFPPRNSTRHPFPNPREIFDASLKGKSAVSDFAISFPHDKHIDIVASHPRREATFAKTSSDLSERAEESCAVCHTTYQPQGDASDEYVTKPPATLGDGFWLKKGTFKTTPISHSICFTCHSEGSGIEPAPSNCAACHKIRSAETRADFDARLARTMGIADKRMLDAWRRRDSSATFRHEWFSHAELSCSHCHNVRAINTLNPATKKVAISSCNTCHITSTADEGGALNFEIDSRKTNPKFQCVKCHIAFGKLPIPDLHFRALAKAAQ